MHATHQKMQKTHFCVSCLEPSSSKTLQLYKSGTKHRDKHVFDTIYHSTLQLGYYKYINLELVVVLSTC